MKMLTISTTILLTYVVFFAGAIANLVESKDFMEIRPGGSHKVVNADNTRIPIGSCTYFGQSLPDDTTCEIFYICEGSPLNPVQYECPPQTLYDPNENQCDANYNCTLGGTCTSSGQEISNLDNCHSYFLCTDTTSPPILVNCGQNQFFNSDTSTCSNNVSVVCGTIPGCRYTGQNFPNYYDCTGFYICDSTFFPVKLFCPDGESYDVVNNKCEISGSAVMCATGLILPECTAPDQRHPNDADAGCTTYYICNVFLEADIEICPTGQLFDSTLLSCQAAASVQCPVLV